MAMSNGLEQVAPFEPFFPVAAEVPETKRHLKLRSMLYELLELAFADQAAIGCDQFVYWDARDPKACLAPDAAVTVKQRSSIRPGAKPKPRPRPHVPKPSAVCWSSRPS
jgi:hypothetical protein